MDQSIAYNFPKDDEINELYPQLNSPTLVKSTSLPLQKDVTWI